MGELGERGVSFREGSVWGGGWVGREGIVGGASWRREGLGRWLVSVFMCSGVSVCIILRFVWVRGQWVTDIQSSNRWFVEGGKRAVICFVSDSQAQDYICTPQNPNTVFSISRLHQALFTSAYEWFCNFFIAWTYTFFDQESSVEHSRPCISGLAHWLMLMFSL